VGEHVGVTGERHTFHAFQVSEPLLDADREEVEYASQNDVATSRPRTAAATSPTPMSIPRAPIPIAMNASPSAMITTGP
jgi:hypothetical protein